MERFRPGNNPQECAFLSKLEKPCENRVVLTKKHTVKMFYTSFWNILLHLLLFPDFVFNILTSWEKIWIQYFYGKMPWLKIFISVTLHLIGQWIFHSECWNRDQSGCGIASPADTQTSAEHGPEQTHVIGPAQSRESDLSFSEPT